MRRSLSLRVTPAVLPSAGPQPEDSLPSSAAPPSSQPSEASSVEEELRNLRLDGAVEIRGFSEASALPAKAASKAVDPRARATLAGGAPTPATFAAPLGWQLQQHGAGGHAAASPAAPAATPSTRQHAAPEVQRLGNRHPSQPGSSRASGQPTVANVSSSGWPSVQASTSVLDDDLPAARTAPPVQEASSGSSLGGATSTLASSAGGGSSVQPLAGGPDAEEESSRWATSPGSVATASTATTAAARGGASPARRAAAPARAASPASTRPPSRSSSRQGGYTSSTAAAEAKRIRPGSAGSVASSRPASSLAGARPGSASPHKGPGGPCSARPALEARVSRQMRRDPADWTVTEVCDWLDFIGLGQYRRRFVHNAVTGSLLLRLSNEELKLEVGIGPLGHREGLLSAINDLEQFWQQQQEEGRRAGGGSSPGGSRPGSPGALPGAHADYSLQRAFAQRARLLRELEKAEGRQAHRAKAAEQAARVAGQASEEVRKLQASLCELDRSLGWQAATQQLFDPLDVHGMRAWQPAGKQAAARPGSGSPMRCVSPGSGGSSSGGSPMGTVSRRLAHGTGGFLERLSADVQARQAKAAEAARRAGRYADSELAEREREARDVRFLKEVVEARNSGLAAMLDSSDPSQLAQACDELAESYQAELGLSDEAVEAVRRLGSPGKKVARLAGTLRSNQFMQRLQQDLATRESRLAELQQRFFRLEKGNSMEQQERADLAAAQAHFGLLGWSHHDLDVAPEDASAGCDAPLGRLLRRAAALQEARQRGKAVDWEAPDWRSDGLVAMQAERNAALQAALDARREAETAAATEGAAAQRYGLQPPPPRQRELPKPADHLGETVEMLAACRPAEVALLEGLAGYRKLVMTWRAVRAQQFIAFTRRDLEARKAKAAQLEAQLYPDNTKVLPKEDYEKFFDRLMSDTQRRAANREELAERAKAEQLARLMKSAPPPPSHRRPKSAAGSRA